MSLLFTLLVLTCAFVVDQVSTEEDKAVSYSGYQVWRITTLSKEEHQVVLKMIEHFGLELWRWQESQTINTPIDVLVPPQSQIKVKQQLDQANISFVVKVADLQEDINDENPNLNASSYNTKAAHKMDWMSYHRLDDIYGYLNYLAETYPNLVQLINIGASYENRTLYVVRISNSSKPDTQPAVWIDGGFHAREWITPALATYIIQQLVEEPANAKLLFNIDWYIMPVVNPDGYEYSHVRNRLWRRTRSNTGSRRCQGVDLNRNFDFKWGGPGSSSNPCSDTFKGSKAFSEPEAVAYSKFIKSKSNQIKLYLSLHSYGQLILLPWGYAREYPSDYNETLALANLAASKFRAFSYRVGNTVDLLYRASGNSADWAKSIGIKYVYIVELPIRGFVLPASFILPVSKDFFPALDVLASKISTLNV
ncbi:carboxypeptidase B-like [Daphnia pulicaria]|uniref:carboxypeptidase B-like n=1 Tax=Daphnia pulicaria TaxID=35523 RepID=UPI001EEA3B90|nr:carboxypeptidase B-like [Daphnia pulicaria]